MWALDESLCLFSFLKGPLSNYPYEVRVRARVRARVRVRVRIGFESWMPQRNQWTWIGTEICPLRSFRGAINDGFH